MKKLNKMVCIDIEVNEKLKDINASALINQLLIEHFRINEPKSIKQLEHRLAEIQIEKRAKKELEELNGRRHN